MSSQRVDPENLKSLKNGTIAAQKKVESSIMELFQSILERELVRAQKKRKESTGTNPVDNSAPDDAHDSDEYEDLNSDEDNDDELEFGTLDKDSHAAYLRQALFNLRFNIRHYDVGHPWVIYWIIHSIYVLNDPSISINDAVTKAKILEFIRFTHHPKGGFCGGHYQFPHVASSYAALCSLIEIGTPEAFATVDRKGMYEFLLRCKNPAMRGGFLLCEGGESDMRGVYIVTVLADVLNIKTPELLDGVVDFICSSQTYEGGIAPEPDGEAHGGLSYCGFAALTILKQAHRINLNRFTNWLTMKQMKNEGGFQGRTNKLVDNCYSFWQGATFRLLSDVTNGAASVDNQLLCDQQKLQAYILLCQDKEGGLFDKPGKFPDLYHTCYSLSGLSTAQRLVDNTGEYLFKNLSQSITRPINVAYNLPEEQLQIAKAYYAKQPSIESLL